MAYHSSYVRKKRQEKKRLDSMMDVFFGMFKLLWKFALWMCGLIALPFIAIVKAIKRKKPSE